MTPHEFLALVIVVGTACGLALTYIVFGIVRQRSRPASLLVGAGGCAATVGFIVSMLT